MMKRSLKRSLCLPIGCVGIFALLFSAWFIHYLNADYRDIFLENKGAIAETRISFKGR